MKVLWLIGVILFNGWSPVFACSVLPTEAFRSPLEVIESATAVRLVILEKAVAQENQILYSFRVLENLKGTKLSKYELLLAGSWPGSTTSIGNHSKYDFWIRSIGGTPLSPSCTIRPSFQLQYKYLIVDVQGLSQIAFEQINTENDHWLIFARNVVKGTTRTSPVLTYSELLEQFSSIHIYNCPSPTPPRELRPRLALSLRGLPPIKPPIPHVADGFSCAREIQFAFLGTDISNDSLLVPVVDGYLDFTQLSRGFELVPENKIALKQIKP